MKNILLIFILLSSFTAKSNGQGKVLSEMGISISPSNTYLYSKIVSYRKGGGLRVDFGLYEIRNRLKKITTFDSTNYFIDWYSEDKIILYSLLHKNFFIYNILTEKSIIFSFLDNEIDVNILSELRFDKNEKKVYRIIDKNDKLIATDFSGNVADTLLNLELSDIPTRNFDIYSFDINYKDSIIVLYLKNVELKIAKVAISPIFSNRLNIIDSTYLIHSSLYKPICKFIQEGGDKYTLVYNKVLYTDTVNTIITRMDYLKKESQNLISVPNKKVYYFFPLYNKKKIVLSCQSLSKRNVLIDKLDKLRIKKDLKRFSLDRSLGTRTELITLYP